MNSESKRRISITLIAVLYTAGVLGLLSPWRTQFQLTTPFTLLISAALLIWNQNHPRTRFFTLFTLCFLVGFGVEYLGVNHQLIFGEYRYGQTLGHKLWNVPVMIGLNWFITIYAIGVVLYTRVNKLLFVVAGALAATSMDWVIEPVAVALDFWSWEGGKIPFSNYVGWFCVSAALFWAYAIFDLDEKNEFAGWFLAIELLFFAILNIAAII